MISRDKTSEELLTEIERVRADNAGLSKAVISIQEERDLAQAEFRAYHKAWEEQAIEIERLQGFETAARDLNNDLIRIAGERDELAARTQELEDALAEYQRLGKTIAGKVPCLTLHGDCGRCSAKMREVCGALEQIAEGKIGPDAALKKQWDDVLGTKPRSWQITEERKAAIQMGLDYLEYAYAKSGRGDIHEHAGQLRAMLEEARQ